ncbi:biotin/lipoyl-binding protein [Novosphingobium sp.]|uniref:biotin/lipoyl-binding protein n=1 Tax=Novosphingobium sp. TaxID=1874826 RepID=UPI001ECDD070|nr:biotin/lipoyl-binding protein [Novosphingobium sp.]MBK9010349.1 biotin/lipoyl-binding protein [Novosphingobium sp.]
MNVPRPLIVVGVLAAVGAAGWIGTRPDPEAGWLGYVEAETLYVAAPVSGRLAARPVERGASVAAGAQLFALDPESSDAETARAAAEVAAAEAGWPTLPPRASVRQSLTSAARPLLPPPHS